MVTMATELFPVGNSGNKMDFDCVCTMPTKFITLGSHGNYGNQVVYLGQKQPKGVGGFRYKGCMDTF
jgi:hypothetical protein